MAVFVDVRVVEEDLVIIDTREGVADLAFAGAEGLDLGALENDPRLVGLDDVVIAPSFWVGEDFGVGHNEFGQKVSLLAEKSELVFERLAALALFGGLDELQFLGEIGRDFVFEDFRQSNVGHTQADGVADQGTAQRAAAGV